MASFLWSSCTDLRLGYLLAVLLPAGAAVWQSAHCSCRKERLGLRVAGFALLAYAVSIGLCMLPQLGTSGFDSVADLARWLCAMGALGGAWLYGRSRVAAGTHFRRWSRWSFCAGLAVVLGLGWIAIGSHAAAVVAATRFQRVEIRSDVEAISGTATGPNELDMDESQTMIDAQPKVWEQAASRRLSAGLPILLGVVAAVGVLLVVAIRS